MSHFEFDGPIPPLQPPKRRSGWGDKILGAIFITMAGAAAYFPWYVFFNEDKFSIKVAAIDRSRDMPDNGPRAVFSVSPMAIPNRNPSENKPLPDALDQLTTATISAVGRDSKTDQPTPIDQPFPSETSFRLVHVANGRALIEDKSGMYMVRVGSVLPDESKLAALEQRDGRWVIVTTKGTVLSQQ